MHVLGILAASISGEHFYALVLSQGVCKSRPLTSSKVVVQLHTTNLSRMTNIGSAIGASMMLYPAISTVSTWFSKRRALALGLTSTVRIIYDARYGNWANRQPPGRLIGRHHLSYNVPRSGANDWFRVDYEGMCHAHLRLRGKVVLFFLSSGTKVCCDCCPELY